MQKYLETLNKDQYEAVVHKDGPLMIVAGAGAGKTKTITHRILHLIHQGVKPQEILAITFTNKAAKEMRERVRHLMANDPVLNLPIHDIHQTLPFLSTFHSLGVHILRESGEKVGIKKNFNIFDRADSKKIIKDALIQLGLDPKDHDPNSIISAISRSKGDNVDLDKFKERANSAFYELVASVWEKYKTQLKKENALDFDDLLIETKNLLHNYPEVRKYYQNKWKYVSVDEFQDTNSIQYAIARLLLDENRNITVVGDADQTIYSWRGADIANFLNFEKDFQGAKLVFLEENYRSSKNIIKAAEYIIKKNVYRKDKNVFTNNKEGDKIVVAGYFSEHEEAAQIAEQARQFINGGIDPKEIAVLYRTNFQSRVLEEAFLQKNVSYQVLGTKFFDRKEIKDAVSYIRLAFNRDSETDLIRVINSPVRGIGKTTILKLTVSGFESLPDNAKEKVFSFYKILDRIKGSLKMGKFSEFVKFVLLESGLETFYREGKSEDLEKLENLRELVSLATKYDFLAPEEALQSFLENVALMSDQDEMEENANSVKLLTVHSSKGLEFKVVFVAGMEKDLFPHKEMNEEEVSGSESEEERRLFYVAVTRAKENLILTFANTRNIFGTQRFNEPSEFLSDIPDEIVEKEGTYSEMDDSQSGVTGVKAIFIDF